jgi:hypothetical protein
MLRNVRFAVLWAGLALAAVVAVAPTLAAAGGLPTGETTLGQTTIEPAYDDANGTLVYLSTPNKAHVNPVFAHNVAPIYLPVYPVGSTVGTLNCQDLTATTVENCPDHGPAVAGAAMQISAGMGFGSVYAGGVLGHDHLVGIASTGGDFNILWEPVLVLFKNSNLANTDHVTTLAELNRLMIAKDVVEIPLPSLTFHCSAVSAAVYQKGTPVA